MNPFSKLFPKPKDSKYAIPESSELQSNSPKKEIPLISLSASKNAASEPKKDTPAASSKKEPDPKHAAKKHAKAPIILSPASIYIPICYLVGCIMISVNFLVLSAWNFFYFSLKNDWNEITYAITGYVTGYPLPYASLIWCAIWIFWAYTGLLFYFHPIRKFWISSWRPRNENATGIHAAKIRMSIGYFHFIVNIVILIATLGAAPILVWRFAPQLFMAPVRLLESFLPPTFLVVQSLYAVAGLPLLLAWSSALSHACKYNPNERSPPCSMSIRGVRVLSLLTVGTFVIWGGAVFFSSLPLWFDSAHFLSGDELPPKPKLFAHRGLTEGGIPENSISAFKAALEHSEVFGIETDVTISNDGIPFCFHDDLLLRTTNIRSVFSDRSSNAAESFSMQDLEQLTLLGATEGEKIPTFKAVLELLVQYPSKRIIFDLRSPKAQDHPFKGKHNDLVQSVIESVPNVSPQVVLLNVKPSLENAFPASPSAVNYEVADLISKGGSVAKKKEASIKIGDKSAALMGNLPAPSSKGLNVEYFVSTQAIRSVRGLPPPTQSLKAWKKGWSGLVKKVKASLALHPTKSENDAVKEPKPFWMCMYVLNEKYLYSQAWCLGVDAVITNTVGKFSDLPEPIWWVPKSKMHYYPLIGFVGGAVFLFWVVVFMLLKFFGCVGAVLSCISSIFCCCAKSNNTRRPTSGANCCLFRSCSQAPPV